MANAFQEGYEAIEHNTAQNAARVTMQRLAARGASGVQAGNGAPAVRLVSGTYKDGGYLPYLGCDRDAIDSGRGCAP